MYDFNAKGDILIERLRTIADGKTTIQLFNEINHATLDVIASVNSSKTMIDKIFYLVEFIDRFRNEC